jgi:ribosomal 30S subunit maturation factor RimM
VEGPIERSLLIVASDGGEVMVPMADGIIVKVDTVARSVVVELPEGLIGLNSATRTSGSD